MTTKIRLEIYRKVIDKVSKKYEGASEFIGNKINKLCWEHGIPDEEVCLYLFMLVILCTQFSYIHSLEWI